jgi:hypothetical protein
MREHPLSGTNLGASSADFWRLPSLLLFGDGRFGAGILVDILSRNLLFESGQLLRLRSANIYRIRAVAGIAEAGRWEVRVALSEVAAARQRAGRSQGYRWPARPTAITGDRGSSGMHLGQNKAVVSVFNAPASHFNAVIVLIFSARAELPVTNSILFGHQKFGRWLSFRSCAPWPSGYVDQVAVAAT